MNVKKSAYSCRNVCLHCSQKLYRDIRGQWIGEKNVASQYCWIDPVLGSQLHEPTLVV